MSVSLVVPTDDGNVLLLQFEATITENYGRSASVTSFPVEEGVDITDHVRTNPRDFTMRGWVSDHPILPLGLKSPSVLGGNPQRRALDAFDLLNEIMDRKQTLRLLTGFGTFDNMQLRDMQATRDKDSGRILDATLSFKEIRIASTGTITPPTPVQTNRGGKTDKGRQVASPPTSADGTTSEAAFDSFLSKGIAVIDKLRRG